MATINSNESKNVRTLNFSRPYDPASGIDEAQWNANPYANTTFRVSPWQNFLMGLGFRTQYDAYKESMQVNANEYYSQLAEKAHNEEYDSPLAQAQRMAEAGLNPDLQNISGGESSAMQPDPNAPIAPGTDYDTFSQFGSMMLSGINMAVGLAESGIGFMNSVQDLRGKQIANDNNLLNTAFQAMLSVTSPEDMENFMTSDMSVQAVNYLPALTEVFGKRRAKKYVSAVNKLATSLKGHDLEMEMRKNFAGNWIQYHQNTSGDGFSMFSDTMKILNKELSSNFWKNLKENTKLEGMRITDESQYLGARQNKNEEGMTMPEIQALNESQSQTYGTLNTFYDYQLKQQQYTMQQSAASVVGKLNELAENGNWFAGLAAMAIQFLFSRFSASGSFGLSKKF